MLVRRERLDETAAARVRERLLRVTGLVEPAGARPAARSGGRCAPEGLHRGGSGSGAPGSGAPGSGGRCAAGGPGPRSASADVPGQRSGAGTPDPPGARDPRPGPDAADPPPPDPGAPRPAYNQVLGAFDPGRRGIRPLLAVALAVLAVAAALAWRSRPEAEPVPVATHPAATVAGTSAPSGAGIVVAVSGRVRRPGLVRLPSGSRVADAIEAAGGALPGTDTSGVNLARKLVDGELVMVGPGTGGQPGPAGQDDAGGAAGLVNLNTATSAQLENLPGIGPTLARRILDYRGRQGGFRSVDELRQVEGIGDAKFAEIKDRVTV